MTHAADLADGVDVAVRRAVEVAAAFGFTPGIGSASTPSQCSGSVLRRPRIGWVVRGSANWPPASMPSSGLLTLLITHWS